MIIMRRIKFDFISSKRTRPESDLDVASETRKSSVSINSGVSQNESLNGFGGTLKFAIKVHHLLFR